MNQQRGGLVWLGSQTNLDFTITLVGTVTDLNLRLPICGTGDNIDEGPM